MDVQTQNNSAEQTKKSPELDEIAQRTIKYGDQVLVEKKPLTKEQAEQWAQQDIAALTNLQGSKFRDESQGYVAGNFSSHPDYKAAFAEKSPELTTEIAAIEVEDQRRIAAKEARKDNATLDDPEASPTVVAQAGRSAPGMTIDQDALERVAAARARDTAQARERLAFNSIEESAESDKAADKRAGGNQVESDEIFTASQSDRRAAVPPEIETQYLRVGSKFYYPKQPEVVAFEDKGNRLQTTSDSEQVAETMVRIAEARGWDEIKLSGSETFRREAWLEAAARGMHVKGYTPSEQDKAELAKRLREVDTNTLDRENKPFRARENETGDERKPSGQARPAETERDRDGTGVVVAHGAAKYMHDEENSRSYYVTTRNNAGVEKTSWGIDLERAMRESGAQVGDKVSITNEGNRPVTVSAPIRDNNGLVVGREEKEAYRNHWHVQLAETFRKDSPADAVKKHPDLAGAYAAEAAMEKQAQADALTPTQKAVVMARVRQNMANSIERGDIPEVKVKEMSEAFETEEQRNQTIR